MVIENVAGPYNSSGFKKPGVMIVDHKEPYHSVRPRRQAASLGTGRLLSTVEESKILIVVEIQSIPNPRIATQH